MKRYACLLLFFPCVFSLLSAQAPVDYKDVGVVINDNDTNSVAIGNYFMAKRNIPLRNAIHVQAPTSETIDSTKFEELRAQIEAYLTANNLADSLNYLVTTKGVPLRASRRTWGLSPQSSSVDADLMLLLGPYAEHIGKATTVVINPNSTVNLMYQPYFNKSNHFSRAQYGIYLVTRLIAYTKDEVLSMIDRSGPNTLVSQDSALFVLDQDPKPIDAFFNTIMVTANQTLLNRGWRVLLNTDSVYVTNQRNVIGYASWGSNDHYDHRYTEWARPKNGWMNASVAETYVSTSARNFNPVQDSGQSRIADLFAEGCTGASGYVFEPYSFSLTQVHTMFDRYTNSYNLAESFYMANPTMSWMAIVVGDPKSSIMTAVPSLPAPSVSPMAPICQNGVITLEAHNVAAGNMNWFESDSAALKAAGKPYDSRHPSWIGQDSILARVMTVPGAHAFTFVNENYRGIGFAQTQTTVRAALRAGFTISVDTVYLDENPKAQFADTTTGATRWTWDFGDGVGRGSIRSPEYSYTAPGTYLVKLSVSDGVCSSMLSRVLVVRSSRTTAAEEVPAVAAAFALERNYPNPFRESTTIRYRLDKAAQVSLTIYNSLGIAVATVVDRQLEAGNYAAVWNSSRTPPGSYFCELIVDSGTKRIHMLHLK
jgi:uncharacterized protein (TIGR03790 family)